MHGTGIPKTIWSIEDLLTATIQGAYNRVVGAAEDALIRAAASIFVLAVVLCGGRNHARHEGGTLWLDC